MWFLNWKEIRRSCFFHSIFIYAASTRTWMRLFIRQEFSRSHPKLQMVWLTDPSGKAQIQTVWKEWGAFKKYFADDRMIYLSVSTCDEVGRFTHEAGVHAALFSEMARYFLSWLHPGNRNTWIVWGSDYGLGTNRICLYIITLIQTRAAKCRFPPHITNSSPRT